MTGAFSAEYGRTGGAVINFVTKGGTNKYHGALYEYFQNGALNANGWQRNRRGLKNDGTPALPRIPVKRNQYGFAIGGPLEIPSRSDRLDGLFERFEILWSGASPDYERGHPYPGGSPAHADLTMAWNWIAERFDCLSVLLEQTFKDTSNWQDEDQGWSPERATRFGASFPTVLYGIIPHLR